MTDAHHRAAIAERAARAGGVVAREQFRTDLPVETKGNKNDLVTQVDRDAQAQVVATIAEEFPDDALVCEEEGGPTGAHGPDPGSLMTEVPDAGAAWIVDPIDGTANFVRGSRTWATVVAAVEDGEPVAAATYLPALGDLYASGDGNPTRDGETVAVSERSDPETFAVAAVGWWAMDDRDDFGRICDAVVHRFGDVRRLGSFQTTLAAVADGGLEAAIAAGTNYPWDTVAGVHLIRQAGGTVTDFAGERWRHDSDGLVASNGRAHDAVLAAARGERE
ncbi:MAG: inositol monophosphatase [Haloarculaceae archaeon]